MTDSNEWIGKTLGARYKIEALLGKGGMSAVYKAFDPNLKRVVAVKVIHPHLSQNPEFLGRFETEAAAVAKLRHPNIVQVYDFNHDEGLFYMVLEYIEGETLFDRLQSLKQAGKQLELKDAIRYAMNVSEAVDYAHQKKISHRDIKPANVVITPQDQAVLMDFGIAKIVGEQAHTAAGNVIGTVKYMAPEQILGKQADHRVDIYSTGVMLFEMLAGHAPFEAESAVTLMKMHLHDPVPNLQELGTDVPASLAAIVAKALEKEPEKRYQTAGELANALKKALIQYEHKEAELFRTVRLSQEDLADLNAPTQQVPVPELPLASQAADPGRTSIIDEARLKDESPVADINKTVAISYSAASADDQQATMKMDAADVSSQPAPEPGAAPAASAPAAQAATPSGTGRKKTNWLLIGGLVLAALIAAAVLASALGIFGGKKETASQAPTATKQVSATLVATAATTSLAQSPTLAPTEPLAPTEAPTEAVPTTEEPAATEGTEGVVDENLYPAGGNPSASQPGELFFQSEFEDSADLSLFNISGDDNAGQAFTYDIADGQLQLTTANAESTVYAEFNLLLENPDVRLETQASKVAGPNSNEIGVYCRSSEQGFYFLAYSANGKWIIYRYQPGTGDNGWNTLASGTSTAIQLTEATNVVAGTCSGNQLVLEVNGTELGAVTDDALPAGGYAGLAIWSEFPGLAVNFDYLTATVP